MACSASTSSLSESSDFTNAPGGNLRFLSCNGDQVLLLTESVIEASDPAPLSFSLASERLTRSQTNASSDGTARDRPTTPPSSPPPLVFQKPLPPEPTHQDATAFANAAGTNVADKASFRWPYNWLMSAFRPDAGKEATQQRMQTSQDTQQGLLFTSTSSSSASTSSSRSAPFSADLPNGKSEFGLGSPYESGLTPVGDNDQPPTPVAIALASKIIAAAKPSAEGSRRRPHDSSDMIGRPSLCAKQTLEAVYGYNHKVPHTLVISRQDDAPMSGAEFERRTRWNR
ncbi:unnamed protein product [Protopolystoma xenopodis]|uniref:Uncharacterized protein n=1 Tax=Protopolystoma xenopodis TaxID=117903 RepID=A0A448X2X2_9PLAT|nr:unnamed protein product [Protopolystoma xenopodis]